MKLVNYCSTNKSNTLSLINQQMDILPYEIVFHYAIVQ